MDRNNSQQLADAQKEQAFSPFNARNRFSFFGNDEANEGDDE